MKNLNVLLVLCCIFYVGTAFANTKRDLPAQVTSPHALNRNSLPTGSQAPISCVGGQSERNRCPLALVAYGQQETDPTWFDPWPSTKGVMRQSRRHGDGDKNHRKTVSTPPARHKTAARHFVKAGQKET